MSKPLPVIRQRFIDSLGVALAGGKLYSYDAGTLTPRATYQDQAEATANDNPTILDANGEADVWIDSSAYRFILHDSNDVEIFDIDNISSFNDDSVTIEKLAKHCVTTAKINDASVTTDKIRSFAVTAPKVADGVVSTAKIINEAVTARKIADDIDFTDVSDFVEVTFSKNRALGQGKVRAIPQHLWQSPTKLSFGTHFALKSSWSPNGEFLAFERKASQKTSIYQREGNSFVEIAVPGTLPADIPSGVAFNHAGDKIAFSMATTSPYIIIYSRAGKVLTKITDPTPPLSQGTLDVRWSPNDEYLFNSRITGAGYLYKDLGSTFETVRTFSDIFWGPSGRYLIRLSYSGSPSVVLFELVGNSFLEVSTPSEQPASDALGAAWSPSGKNLAVITTSTPYIYIYDVSGESLTKADDPADLPAGQPISLAWSPSGRYLAVGHATTPFITIYEKTSAGFVKLDDPSTLPDAAVSFISWSPDTRFLVAHHNTTSPYISLYETGHTFPDNALLFVKENFSG